MSDNAGRGSQSKSETRAPEGHGASRQNPSGLRRRVVKLAIKSVITLAITCGVVAIAAVLATTAQNQAEQLDAAEPDVPPLVVDATPAVVVDGFDILHRFLGSIEASRRSRVSFEVAATVTDVFVDEGGHVSAGDRIAQLDVQRLTSRLAAVRAEIGEVRANLELAEATAARTRAAFENDTVSRQRLDEADQQTAFLKANLDRIPASAGVLEVDLEKSELRAPFAGRVTRRFIDEGVVVQPGEPIVELIETSGLEARVGVPVAVARALDVGDVMQLEVAGRMLESTVSAIVSDVSPGTRTTDIILRSTTSDLALPPGTTATLFIPRRVDQLVVSLPRVGLVESVRGLWAVYAVVPHENALVSDSEGTHRVVTRQVEVLHLAGDRAYVTGGVREGDLIVMSGVHRLVDRLPVRLAMNEDGSSE